MNSRNCINYLKFTFLFNLKIYEHVPYSYTIILSFQTNFKVKSLESKIYVKSMEDIFYHSGSFKLLTCPWRYWRSTKPMVLSRNEPVNKLHLEKLGSHKLSKGWRFVWLTFVFFSLEDEQLIEFILSLCYFRFRKRIDHNIFKF